MKKVISLLVSIIMIMSIALPAAAISNTSTKKVFKNKKMDFYMFKGAYGDDAHKAIIAKFEKAYGVKVNLVSSPKIDTLLRPKMVAGNTPDLIQMNWGDSSGILNALYKENAFLDMTSLLNEKALDGSSKLKDTFQPGFLESVRCAPYGDGKVYTLPLAYSPMGLVYNKNYFDKKGLKAPKTWEEFFALGEVAKKDERALFTYQGIYPGYLESLVYASMAAANGVSGFKDFTNYKAGSFKNAGVRQVLTNIQNIAAKGYLMEGTTALNHTASQTAMMQGKALFITNGTWMENEMKDAPREDGFQYAMAPAPALKAGDKTYIYCSIDSIFVPKAAKNPELAKEFLKFLYTKDSQKIFAQKAGGIMPIKGTVELCKPVISPTLYNFFSMFNSGNTLPLIGGPSPLPAGSKLDFSKELWDKPVTNVMTGKMTVDQWIDDVEKAMAQARADIAKAAAED